MDWMKRAKDELGKRRRIDVFFRSWRWKEGARDVMWAALPCPFCADQKNLAVVVGTKQGFTCHACGRTGDVVIEADGPQGLPGRLELQETSRLENWPPQTVH